MKSRLNVFYFRIGEYDSSRENSLDGETPQPLGFVFEMEGKLAHSGFMCYNGKIKQ